MTRANRSLRREKQLLSIHKDRARIEAAAVGRRLAPGSTVVCGGLTVTRGNDGALSLRMTRKD